MLFIENFPHVAFHATPWLLAAWNAMAVDKFVPKPKKENDKGDEKDDGDEDSFHAFHATPWILAAWNAMAVDKFVPKPKKENDKSDEKDDGDEDSSGKKPEKPEDKTCDWTARLRAVRTTTCPLIDSRVQKVSEAGSDELLLSGLSHSKLPLM